MNETVVIGHLNPDTDSTCSAIAFAWYLNQVGQKASAKVVGKPNKEAAFALERFGFETPEILESFRPESSVVIVDTNNPEELAAGWQEASIVEIIDHHKLFGGLSTVSPIKVTMQPVACTATLIFQRMQKEGVSPSMSIAGILLSAILSDTLNYSSPTTTEVDRSSGKTLAELAQVDANELAESLFAAKSDIADMDDPALLMMDSKVFTFGGRKCRVSVLETVKPEYALERRASLLSSMESMKKEEGLDGAFLFIVDIIQGQSTLLVAGVTEAELAERAFTTSPSPDGTFFLPEVVSRKKQMVPKLEAAA